MYQPMCTYTMYRMYIGAVMQTREKIRESREWKFCLHANEDILILERVSCFGSRIFFQLVW